MCVSGREIWKGKRMHSMSAWNSGCGAGVGGARGQDVLIWLWPARMLCSEHPAEGGRHGPEAEKPEPVLSLLVHQQATAHLKESHAPQGCLPRTAAANTSQVPGLCLKRGCGLEGPALSSAVAQQDS